MSKLACRCGHVISDNTEGLAYKARLLPEAHDEDFFSALADAAQSFADAVAKGQRDRWLKEHGFNAFYPRTLTDGQMFNDFAISLWVKYTRDCYECTECGRLHLQDRSQENLFHAYTPADGRYEGVLRGRIEDGT